MRPGIPRTFPPKSGTGRLAVLLVGLGVAGVAIGWIGPGTLTGQAQRPAGQAALSR